MGRFCKKQPSSPRFSCKSNYFNPAISDSRSEAWEFFTRVYLVHFRGDAANTFLAAARSCFDFLRR
jgi:hypothetical protein